jgi:hypothetical protein
VAVELQAEANKKRRTLLLEESTLQS